MWRTSLEEVGLLCREVLYRVGLSVLHSAIKAHQVFVALSLRICAQGGVRW